MIYWAFLTAGIVAIGISIIYTKELEQNYHASLPTALMISGTLSTITGVLYYNSYTKNSLGLYFLTRMFSNIVQVILSTKP
jgi:hypothetical protein